jgi:hypothetical protein
LAPPEELPANDWISGLFKPKALAVPKPVEGWGLLFAAMARLSKVQAVRVFAAFAPDSEASSSDAMQAMFFVFIQLLVGCLLVFLCKSDGTPVSATWIIHCQVTNKWRTYDNLVTSFSCAATTRRHVRQVLGTLGLAFLFQTIT